MSDPLPYLREYLSDPSLESLSRVDAGRAELPQAWVDVLSVDGHARLERALSLWDPFAEQLPELIGKLKSSLVSLDLLRYGGEYSLLYGIQGLQRTLYYEAKNPRRRKIKPNVSALWSRLPQSIQDFYSLHDGWYYLASHSMGLSPTEDVFVLSDEDWEVLERIDPPAVDLDKTLALFTNGMSGYVCVDLSKQKTDASALIWWSNKAPKLDLEFWSVVDAWTVIGLESEE